MGRGAKAIAYILILAFSLGFIVILAHPQYRAAAKALLGKKPEQSPIWLSNHEYYPEVALPQAQQEPDAN